MMDDLISRAAAIRAALRWYVNLDGGVFNAIKANIKSNLEQVPAVSAVPFVSSLRNDRQDRMDGDNAPRNTPVDMIFYCNAEELMTIANKRLCNKAAPMTRRAVQMMCLEALDKMPELTGLLVPICERCGGVCHEIESCGKCTKG